MNYDKIEASAKAAFPELWPDNAEKLGPEAQAGLVYQRQNAIDRTVAALAAYVDAEPEVETVDLPVGDVEAEPESEEGEGVLLDSVTLSLPEDAAMVQQTMTVLTYIDEQGRTAHAMHFTGDGQRTSWLGMCVLAQDYILKQPSAQ